MIDIHKDLFVRLVTSAQKDRKSNIPFREDFRPKTDVSPATLRRPNPMPSKIIPSQKPLIQKPGIPAVKETPAIDQKISGYNITKPSQIRPYHNIDKKINIDEQINRIVDNPELHSIKQEIQKLESLFIELKKKHAGHEALARIENKILELKELADRKSYV